MKKNYNYNYDHLVMYDFVFQLESFFKGLTRSPRDEILPKEFHDRECDNKEADDLICFNWNVGKNFNFY